MRKKIITVLLVIIILLQTIFPIKVSAIRNSASVENEMTGLDLMAGILIEPTVEFFTFVLDGIMSVFTGVMTQEEIQFVMVDQDKKDTLPDLGQVGATFTIDDMKPYESAKGNYDKLKYPRFTYSPEEIFAGNVDLLDINFIDDSNTDTNWRHIRSVVAQWYKVLRMIAIIGLLSVLIYTGIKIILSSNSKDKAKYKEMIGNWFVAVVLAFSMHYIMAFILAIMEEILGLLGGLTGVIEVIGGEGFRFKTNLMGLARFQMQQEHFSAKIGHLVIYAALVIYTFKFTFVYLKRVLRVAFLTVIAPIVAITYPIDKMDGEAKGFQLWLKEFIFNALLQPMHYLLYYVLVTTSLSLAAQNPVYGIAALMFMTHAEKLLKRIFGFDKARGGTVGGLSNAFATGAIVSSLTNLVRDPMHPLGNGKGKGKGKSKSGGKGSSKSKNGDNDDENGIDFLDDTQDDSVLFGLFGINEEYQEPESSENPNTKNPIVLSQQDGGESSQNAPIPLTDGVIPDVDRFFERYRQDLPISVRELGGLSFDDDELGSFEEILALLAQIKRTGINPGTIPPLSSLGYEEIQGVLRSRVDLNEINFFDNNIQPQYIDGDSRSCSDLLEEIMRLNALATDISLPSNERRQYTRQSEKLLKQLKRRMAQNEHIQRNGGPLSLQQQEQERIENLRGSAQSHDTGASGIAMPNIGQQQGRNKQPSQPQEVQQPSQSPTQTIADQYEKAGKKVNPPTEREIEKDEQMLKREESWERIKIKQKQVLKGGKNVAVTAGKTLIKPVWDVERGLDWKYNGKRLAGNILKGYAGVTVGIGAAAVQAGISITDGKYKPIEGIATVGAGIAGVTGIANAAGNKIEEKRKDQQTLERYSEQWFNRDDVIGAYNREYPGEGKAMRRRAVENYVSRGITDLKDQKQAIKYADTLMKERGLDQVEADKIAVATLQYKKSLTRNNSYMVLFDAKKRDSYLKTRVEAYSGAASSDSIRRLHGDLIDHVRDFDKVNN